MPHVIVMGVSGSGKSTVAARLADTLDRPFAEADDMHPPANVAKMSAGVPLTDDDRWPWLRTIRDWMSARAAEGRSSVVTCSALRRVYRDVLREADGGVRFVQLDGDYDVLAGRLGARRDHFMPPRLLDSQLDTLEPLEPDEDGVRIPVDQSPERVVAEALRASRSV